MAKSKSDPRILTLPSLLQILEITTPANPIGEAELLLACQQNVSSQVTARELHACLGELLAAQQVVKFEPDLWAIAPANRSTTVFYEVYFYFLELWSEGRSASLQELRDDFLHVGERSMDEVVVALFEGEVLSFTKQGAGPKELILNGPSGCFVPYLPKHWRPGMQVSWMSPSEARAWVTSTLQAPPQHQSDPTPSTRPPVEMVDVRNYVLAHRAETSDSAPLPEPAERLPVPADFCPPVVSTDNDAELITGMESKDAFGLSKQIDHLALELGFELGSFHPDTTAAKARECWKRALMSFLEAGAHLWRARALLGTKFFWNWFDEQNFPFGREWAKDSIHAIQQLEGDPALRKVAKRISSAKHFQVVARRLADPAGRAEWDSEGTVLGHLPEDLDKLSHRDVEALVKQTRELKEKLVDTQGDLEKATKQASELDAQLAKEKKDAGELRTRLLAMKMPETGGGVLEADFIKELNNIVNGLLPMMGNLRPMGRKDMDSLSKNTIFRFWTAIHAVELGAAMVLREIEYRWQNELPELLIAPDGRPMEPSERATLRICEERAQEATSAHVGTVLGKKFSVVNGKTGEVVYTPEANG